MAGGSLEGCLVLSIRKERGMRSTSDEVRMGDGRRWHTDACVCGCGLDLTGFGNLSGLVLCPSPRLDGPYVVCMGGRWLTSSCLAPLDAFARLSSFEGGFCFSGSCGRRIFLAGSDRWHDLPRGVDVLAVCPYTSGLGCGALVLVVSFVGAGQVVQPGFTLSVAPLASAFAGMMLGGG